jgi:GT2 family glycosyltransferase
MKRILVIVVTYNGLRWLDRCLGSVAGDGRWEMAMTVDLFVVDNDSADGSADYVQAHFPKTKLVRSAENLGFSKANNLGMQYALDHGYDYVYLLNQDAWLESGAMEKLVEAAEAHPEYAVLSPLQMTDGYKDVDRLFKKDKTPPAAHWLVRVQAIRKIGLLDETLFPLYGQDDNWCHRARYHGYKVGIVPEARAVHDRAQRKEDKDRLIFRNYYTGSLVRLANPNIPVWISFLYIIVFTLVKTVKYFSFRPLGYFVSICKKLPELVSLQDLSKKDYGNSRHT